MNDDNSKYICYYASKTYNFLKLNDGHSFRKVTLIFGSNRNYPKKKFTGADMSAYIDIYKVR